MQNMHFLITKDTPYKQKKKKIEHNFISSYMYFQSPFYMSFPYFQIISCKPKADDIVIMRTVKLFNYMYLEMTI